VFPHGVASLMLFFIERIRMNIPSADSREYLQGKEFKRGVSSTFFITFYINCLLSNGVGQVRDNNSNVVSIRRRSQWTPPTFERYSSFIDSGLELSDGSASAPASSSSARNSATSDTLQSRRKSKAPPYELDAADTRDPRTIREVMMLQHERDRVRNEEVAPLEEIVRKLKATQLEQMALHPGLRSPSSEVSAQLLGMTSQDIDDTPLINLSSSNPSRTNSVRHERQLFEGNSNFNDLYDP
jgi:hypothetical protein